MALAEPAGLADLAGHVRIARPCWVNAQVTIGCLVAGMIAGRTASMTWACCAKARCRACSAACGRHPPWARSCGRSPGGNVLQLQKAHREFLAELAGRAPLLPGAGVLAFADIGSQQKRAYGHAKQGAAFGFTKIQGKGLLVRGLNVLAATISTPLAAPVIAATRLRGGNASSARAAGCTGTIVVRMDSAFCGSPACSAARRAGAHFSVTVRMDPKVRAAIAAIGEDAWIPINYPQAVWDDQFGHWISDAQVAETQDTAFTFRKGIRPRWRHSSSVSDLAQGRAGRFRENLRCTPPPISSTGRPYPAIPAEPVVRPQHTRCRTRSQPSPRPWGQRRLASSPHIAPGTTTRGRASRRSTGMILGRRMRWSRRRSTTRTLITSDIGQFAVCVAGSGQETEA
jgi:hypothetical protein